ncbi:hypothetical protein JOD43_004376 [Pullulanibacillus pueri]|uniref:Uncharacterized protein n=1 Tax=Pullulanibacillus pueri TaxID=1437324 RepID=A0A8J2ZZT0_9BACL|nr:hypothetical protein [Pullulanibacillus pueri]MBM7684163.1 hypothetical protein [Pullulanibacillus pueri]GGH88853.1 hypothetical protein GCM10007096_42130 [Pullulanibacillus pueri]
MWSTARILRLITCILEAILAIPIFGGSVILLFSYVPLGIMLVLHIITLIFSTNTNETKAGSIIGIITSVLGWIPFVGWALHLVSAIVLLIGTIKPSNTNSNNTIVG